MDKYQLDLYTDYLMITFGYATRIIKAIRWLDKPRYIYKYQRKNMAQKNYGNK